MSAEAAAGFVGVLANGATLFQALPQIVRLMRTGRTEGVSSSWAAVGVAINLGWTAWAVAEQVWIALPSMAAAISAFGLTLLLLRRNGASIRVGVCAAAAVLVASGALQAAFGWTALGTVLAMSNAACLGPPVATAWRTHVPAGVSPGTWMLGVAEGLLWGLFGVLVWKGPIVVYGATAALLSALVLLRLWVARHRIKAERALSS